MVAVSKETEKWFGQNLSAPQGAADFDPLHQEFMVRPGTDDRTLLVDMPDFGLLNEGLLHRLQKEMLGKHPWWRIALVGENEATSVMVYPEVIRVGNRPATSNVDQALHELDSEVRTLRRKRLEPKRREIEYLRRKIPAAIQQIGNKPFQVIGISDEYQGDRSRMTIYLLLKGTDRDVISVEGPEGPSHIWRSSAFGLDAKGKIMSNIGVPETAAFCIVPWLPPSDYRGPVTMVETETGAQHVYEIKSEDIARLDER
jgi:hypothetical protein